MKTKHIAVKSLNMIQTLARTSVFILFYKCISTIHYGIIDTDKYVWVFLRIFNNDMV
jgi:hypothetical protein